MSNTKKLVSFDWAIKRLLRNKASFAIFEGFLSELLREDIKIKSLLESESNRETKNDWSNRVDMLVENSKGELIIGEIQRETEYDYLQRILFGSSKLLVEYMKKSMPYSKIKKVISISLVYFDLGVGEDYAYHGLTQFIGLNKKISWNSTVSSKNCTRKRKSLISTRNIIYSKLTSSMTLPGIP